MFEVDKTQESNQKVLDEIAKEHLDLDTLERRGGDSLDFSDQAVWSIRAALEAAYEAGKIDVSQ